jgi:hypothetical protein
MWGQPPSAVRRAKPGSSPISQDEAGGRETPKNSLFPAIFLSKILPFGATIVTAEKSGTPASLA